MKSPFVARRKARVVGGDHDSTDVQMSGSEGGEPGIKSMPVALGYEVLICIQRLSSNDPPSSLEVVPRHDFLLDLEALP